jgi:G:T-mismatch repair DNA endonuclease (very short patch repair protein)
VNIGVKKVFNIKTFIIEAEKIHGNKYDYSSSVYLNSRMKIKIICKKHGSFLQTSSNHLKGQGCKECSKQVRRKKLAYTKEIFISKAKSIHGIKYDYKHIVYVNNQTNITLKCPKHNIFTIKPREHLLGRGCVYCSDTRRLTTKSFIEKAKLLHENKYDYSLVEYVNYYNKVKIICPKHGIFEQAPTNHLHIEKYGCPKCLGKISKKQLILYNDLQSSFLKENICLEHLIKTTNKNYYADICFKDKKLIVEYYGDYWHCNPEKYDPCYFHPHKKITAKQIWNDDKQRIKALKQAGYKVFIVWESNYQRNKNFVTNNINKLLNVDQTVIM